jgi:acetyltransferase-like isoleucine patch superfamily enzyme
MVARMINKNLNPNARVHQTVIFEGSGEVIAHANSQIRAYSVIEMDKGSLTVGHNSVLGYHTFIQCTGKITIGKGSLLGPHCCFVASSHAVNERPLISQPMIRGAIIIGDNVWFGANCTINMGVIIGDNAIIGANSFVNKNIPANTVYAGSPAKYIRQR